MCNFEMLKSRVSRGWELLCLEDGCVKNINHIHVTYVLGEILLLWMLFPEKVWPLTFCLLFHLMNFLLGISDKANAVDANAKNAAIMVYWTLEIFIFLVGCVADWRLILFHEAASYIVPLFFFGLQTELLRVWFSERKIPNSIRGIAWFLCLVITLIPYSILCTLLLIVSGIWWQIKLIFLILYLVIGMPLMIEFEDSEENLFEFAFKMLN
ncbi:MAG: hypothetical protein J6M02_04700 [Clostridia bacterium]|nr:hypothetical protein [Clostridia bacterium]